MKACLGRPTTILAVLALSVVAAGPPRSSRPGVEPRPFDDVSYRPSVLIHKGPAVGTGTIIASTDGETLILTAAHVVEDAGPLTVEIHRFNLGIERSADPERFPRRVRGRVLARDLDADLAIVKVSGLVKLPYVARLASDPAEDPVGQLVTSLGFDHGEILIGFDSRITRVDQIDMDKGKGPRRFLVTDNVPELGRSGGGLYRLSDGALVGVCVAKAKFVRSRMVGLHATLPNVYALIASDPMVAASIRRAQPGLPIAALGRKIDDPVGRPIEPTRANRERTDRRD